MVRLSNSLVGVLNFLTFLASLPILVGGIWLSVRGSSDCDKFLDKPLIILGVFLMLVSLAGLIGSCCRVSWLLWVYLLVMFLLIVIVLCFTIFAFFVTNKGAGEVVSGRGYKEYKLGDYSNWLQKRVEDSKNWKSFRSCIQQSHVCENLADENIALADFIKKNLSPLESGCCKPPTECGFKYVNATNWSDTTGNASANADCKTWNNDKDKLCYDCRSCKAGLLANLKSDWKKVAIVNITFLIILIIIYSVGCCAFRNNRNENKYAKRYARP